MKSLIVLLIGAAVISGCKKDEPVDQPENAPEHVIALRAQGTSAESTDYLLAADNIMSGELTAEGQGIEQTGWRYFTSAHNTVFSIGYGDDNNCIGYHIDDSGQLVEKGRFVFQTTLDVAGEMDDDVLLAMEVPRGAFIDRVFHRIDANGVSIISKVPTSIYENREDSLVAWPTAIVQRGNEVFVPFYLLHARGDFTTPSADTAYVAVYSYPDLELKRYIKDTRMGPIGIYGNASGMIKTENGDLYGYSAASLACGFTSTPKKSGILRIRNGENEFDAGYFLDIESAAGGKKLSWFHYIGNGMAIGRMVTDDSQLWGAFTVTNPICQLVLINLEAQTVTEVSGVPLHGGQYSTPVLLKNDKVYMNITTGTDAHIYEIDPASSTAVKGALIKGQEVQGIYSLN
ncbi:MAG: DUF4374 domain-containing protein [Bacteroidia bacterium]